MDILHYDTKDTLPTPTLSVGLTQNYFVPRHNEMEKWGLQTLYQSKQANLAIVSCGAKP